MIQTSQRKPARSTLPVPSCGNHTKGPSLPSFHPHPHPAQSLRHLTEPCASLRGFPAAQCLPWELESIENFFLRDSHFHVYVLHMQ